MIRKLGFSGTLLAATLAGLSGCHDSSDTQAARAAEQAVGVAPGSETTKAVDLSRDVTVVKETKVIDNATGQTISETKEETPVKIQQEKQVKTNVKVDVGNSSVVTPAAK